MLLTELGTFSKDYETRTLTALIFFKTKCGTKMTQAKVENSSRKRCSIPAFNQGI